LTAAELIMRFKQVAITQTNTQRRVFYLHQLIHEVELVMCEKIQDAGHHLEVQVPPDIRFDSYPDPLEQVMISLINNALQHAFEGIQGGKMTLLAHKVSEEQIRIEFHDNGKGIAAQYLARIFDPFFTINNNRGCGGLGLHISHNIVTSLLSGEIKVESEVEVGTAFVLELPLNTPVKY
jgi:signal transduction histidine kinase